MKLNKTSENKTKSTIGLNIQKLLDIHDISLSKVATATGLSSETIRQIINGTIKNPGIETLKKIAETFSISLAELLGTNEFTSQINKKKIKIVDIFDVQKLNSGIKIEDLINRSIESTEILFVNHDTVNSEIFAMKVNSSLADKLTNCGMPMINQGDLLIFKNDTDCSKNSIILARCDSHLLMLGIVIEREGNHAWVKSVDIPQKQIVTKIKIKDIVGMVHNVQFTS